MTEEQLQNQCYLWFHNTFGAPYRQMLFHVDNNSWNRIIGAKKKALGVCAGVSDMIFISFLGRALFLEFKTDVGVLSKEQKEFGDKVTLRGHKWIVIRSFKQFQMIILTEINKAENDK